MNETGMQAFRESITDVAGMVVEKIRMVTDEYGKIEANKLQDIETYIISTFYELAAIRTGLTNRKQSKD